MSAYVIYQGEVTDPERYDAYKVEAARTIAEAGGTYLVRGGEIEVLEGDPPAGRTVVLEFPTMQAALDWYHGPAYSAVRPMREGASRAHMYVVEGYT